MVIKISKSQFVGAFKMMGREDQFSRSALMALYDYFIQLEDECGTEFNLDVISICCEFAEYADLKEFHADYDAEEYPDIDSIRDSGTVIELVGGGLVVQNF